jgi:phosphate transport system substrate-binding protein
MMRKYSVSCDPQRSWRMTRSFPTILFLCLFVGIFVNSCTISGSAGTQLKGTIQIDGSTALLPLVTKAAAAFDKLNPGVDVVVSGGGSFTGLNDVYSRNVHIGDSDVYASFAAYPNPDMTDHIVCVVPYRYLLI